MKPLFSFAAVTLFVGCVGCMPEWPAFEASPFVPQTQDAIGPSEADDSGGSKPDASVDSLLFCGVDEDLLYTDYDGSKKHIGAPCGTGLCAGGMVICRPDGTDLECDSWAFAEGERCNGQDDDCDGLTDAADPDLPLFDVQPCELREGICKGWTKSAELCNASNWLECFFEPSIDQHYPAGFEPLGEESCSDGIDNDCNGMADCSDPACFGLPACSHETPDRCHDGRDNDNDGDADCADEDCAMAPACTDENFCCDHIDNDVDGLTDCYDPTCFGGECCVDSEGGFCDDRQDNDEDGLTDCGDNDCSGNQGPDGQLCQSEENICDDNDDNDADGLTDCADFSCDGQMGSVGQGICEPFGERSCADGFDNDADGQTDCFDSQCNHMPCEDSRPCTWVEICVASHCGNAVSGGPTGVLCDGGRGACESGECLAFLYALPSGEWTFITGEPAPFPDGCGAPELPCNPSGPTFPWPADTGLTTCYDAYGEIPCDSLPEPGTPECAATAFCGQDAQYGWDVTRPGWDDNRFVVSGTSPEEIVTDKWTGMVWAKEFSNGKTWVEALAYCENLEYAGRRDWRLPDRFELQSLLHFNQIRPASDFPAMTPMHQPPYVWSSTSTFDPSGGTSFATLVYFDRGLVVNSDKNERHEARCVAFGPATISTQRFFLNETFQSEPVVFDTRTGLLWQENINGDGQDLCWDEALAHCEELNYGGRSDWRLPNVFELASIFDPTVPYLDVPNPVLGFQLDLWFWSSSSLVGVPGGAWFVSFEDGFVRDDIKGRAGYAVRCVALGP